MTDSSDDMIRTPLSYGSFESQKGYDQKQLVPEEGRRPTLSYFDSNGITEVAEPHLGFIDVSYTIPSGIFSKKKGKIILDSVSGLMPPGVNAIMGPTGSGKTTLLDILANRKSSSRVSGNVLFNCESIKPNFRFNTGYVVQEDIVTGTLTVRENLHFSAALRLPSSMSGPQKRARVNKIINQLDLNSCADQKIGTEFIRGVSGGERKRTNIGMELIIEPQILFLDEPTTGLDARTAESVIQLLKNLTKDGSRIVILAIHQPRYSIFRLFDTLTLLSQGRLVYHGLAKESLEYFHQLGFQCEEHDNPADFFLDVIDSCEEKQKEVVDDTLLPFMHENREHTARKRMDLGDSYRQSEHHSSIHKTLEPLLTTEVAYSSGNGKCADDCSNFYATNIFWQFLIVSYRAGLKMWRNPMTNVMQLIVMVLFGTITGGIFFQRPDTPRGMQDRLGAFFFIIMSQVFGGLGAIELFINEKVSFLHETSSGYYRVSVYFVAKVITDLLILRTLPLSVFSSITYFMIGLQLDVKKFFLFYLTLSVTTIAGAAIAFTFSALVNVFAVANLLVSLVFVFYMLFGGTLIGLSSLPDWIQWMKYISLFRYSIEALAVNELKGQMYSEELPTINGTIDPKDCLFTVEERNNSTFCVANGTQILEFQGFSPDWEWYYDQCALIGTAVLWLILTYIILRMAKKYYEHYK